MDRERLELEKLNFRISKLMLRVEEQTKKKVVGINKDIVAFLGPTKAGKSTLINCLIGTPLRCRKDLARGTTCIIKEDGLDGPKIGQPGESQTEEPESFQNMVGTNLIMWDFAGTGDNKGTDQEVVNTMSYQNVLCQQETVRFVLVVPFEMIADHNPYPFYQLLDEIQKICPVETADSLCMVFTKFREGDVQLLLESALSYPFIKSEDNMDKINRSRRTIEKVLLNRSWIVFGAPVMEGNVKEASFTLPNKQQVIECIRKLKGTKVSNFSLVVSDQAKNEIAELYAFFYQQVKKEVDYTNSVIERFIQTKINEILEAKEKNGKPTDAKSKLANFQTQKSKILLILENSKDFKSFFNEVIKAGLVINVEFSRMIEKFLFIENLRNMYKRKTSQGNMEVSSAGLEEFFANVREAVMNGARKYSAMIASSEVASAEEKRLEKEWKERNDIEMKDLKEKIEELNKKNNSILVRTAQYVSQTKVADLAYKAAEFLGVVEATENLCLVS